MGGGSIDDNIILYVPHIHNNNISLLLATKSVRHVSAYYARTL